MSDKVYKDLSRWELPVYHYSDIESVSESGFLHDGIYQIELAAGHVLDVLVQNAAKLDSAKRVLVGFNGAVTHREKKKSPFFSGMSLAKDMDVPSIAISDPTLDIDGKVGLAWYAGNYKVKDLPQKIAQLLNAIALKHDLTPVMFGGSGAGFAILNIAPHLTVPHIALVWNPQTRIAKYFLRFVQQYASSAFPGLWAKLHSRKKHKGENLERFLESFLERAGISHTLSKSSINPLGQVLYLQNRRDWHVEQHTNPYLVQFTKWKKNGPAAFSAEDGRLGVVFPDWGDGHVAPPRSLVRQLLEFCLADKPIYSDEESNNIFALFNEESEYRWPVTEKITPMTLDLRAAYSENNDSILAEICLLHPVEGEDYLVAFYLMLDGVRQQVRWYETKPYVTFDLRETEFNAANKKEVIAFVKNSAGDIQRTVVKL